MPKSKRILVLNSGSSSLKFQLFDMPEAIVLAQGQIEKIGLASADLKVSFREEQYTDQRPAANHQQALSWMMEVIQGTAEHIPYKDLSFDFVLFVTICHLSNFKEALIESHRILKPKGSIVIGFIDKDQTIGKAYEAKRKDSVFFKNAVFYSVSLVTRMLKEAGFKNLVFNQTLFGELDEISQVQLPKSGFGEGSFVVVKADKK